MIQSAGEDGDGDLHHNIHDVNEVGRLGAQNLFVNDAVHIVYGLGVSIDIFWLGEGRGGRGGREGGRERGGRGGREGEG